MQLEMTSFDADKPSVVKRAKKPRVSASASAGEEVKEAGEQQPGAATANLAKLRLQPGSKMAAAISRNSQQGLPPSAQGGDSPSVSEKHDKI